MSDFVFIRFLPCVDDRVVGASLKSRGAVRTPEFRNYLLVFSVSPHVGETG